MLILESAEQHLLGVWNGNSKETGLLLLFLCALQTQGNAFHPDTKRCAAYLYILAPLEEQVRLGFSCSVCHLKQIKHQDPRTSRMHHQNILQILNGAYMRHSLWNCRSRNIYFLFFFPLFWSQVCSFWLKAHKISKQTHFVYYYFPFLPFSFY